jgi:hypothetical protein
MHRTKRTVVALTLVAAAGAGPALVIVGPGVAGATSTSQIQSQLQKLEGNLKNTSHLKYKATYTFTGNGKTQTITVEQAPPKSAFRTAQAAIIDTGTKTYYCSMQASQNVCFSESGTNLLGGLTELFSPATITQAMKTYGTELGSKLAGFSVSTSSAKFAGQSATCVQATSKTSSGKYCILNNGVTAYVAGSGTHGSTTNSGQIKLTAFSSNPPSSDFSLPSGATVENLGGGGTPGASG